MKKTFVFIVLLAGLVPVVEVAAREDGFRPLFNGRDLEGWVAVNTAPSTWTVDEGMIICSGKPTGELRTNRMYQNFILELEWRHMKPRGNAGVFVWADDITARGVPFHRSIEVQVLENDYGNTASHTTHGDIFPIHGATMIPVNGRGGSRAFPTENRSKPSPEWNHYRIECRDGEISLAVNGKVVTRGTNCSPRKGYICLESEGGLVHYRNLTIKVLPDTPVEARHVAIANRNFRSLYSGVDLNGWDVEGDGWKSRDWVLAYQADDDASLATTETFEDIGFVFDVRIEDAGQSPQVTVRGATIAIGDPQVSRLLIPKRAWNRFEGQLTGDRLTLMINGEALYDGKPVDAAGRGPITLRVNGPVEFANLFVRPLPDTE